MFTIAPRANEQFFSSTLAGFGGPDFPFRLLFGVMEVLGGEAGPGVASSRLLSEMEGDILVLGVVAGGDISLLRLVGVVYNFFDLMFDLFFADGAVIVGRVF